MVTLPPTPPPSEQPGQDSATAHSGSRQPGFPTAGHGPYTLQQLMPDPRARRRRTGLVIGLIAAVVVVLVGVATAGVLMVRNVGPFKDSGVAMCEQIRDAKTNNTTVTGSTSSDGKLTLDGYHKLRRQFADSRYADLRDAGTKFIDLAWQLAQSTDSGDSEGALGAVLLMGGQIMQLYSSLAGACANHGVDLPPLR